MMRRNPWAVLALLAATGITTAQEEEAKQPEFPPFAKIGQGMEAQKGFWNLLEDQKKTKFWVEIPAAQLNQPFLVATSITGGTTQAGWQWNDWLLVFQRNDKRLVLLERNVGYSGKGGKTLEEVVARTYTDRVLATYPILTMGPNGGFVVDGKILLAGGASLFFGRLGASKDPSLASFAGSKTFQDNTEISLELPAPDGRLVALHYSISRLAGKRGNGYRPRAADDRIGYFMTVLKDFSATNKDDERNLRYVNRWDLQKADAALPVSPPREPIIFYIEKSVPLHLRRYVKEGIEEWNKAFEKVGFQDAVVVRQQTDDQFADLDPEDVRYNFFRWIVSETPFAMGPSRVNPMTGQILDADIIFDDSFLRYSLREYRLSIREVPTAVLDRKGRDMLAEHPFAALGLTVEPDEFWQGHPEGAPRPMGDPHGRRAFCSLGHGIQHQLGCAGLHFAGAEGPKSPGSEYPEQFVGQILKDTVMHEVGHTLGLRHNFKASVFRSYDEVTSDSKPADIAGSVMDYAATVIAPEGRTQGYYAMGTLGPYDYWAIEYGYALDDKELPKILARVAEKGLDYATDEDTMSQDPYVNRWDMGSDPLDFAKRRLEMMKRLRKNLEERAVDKGEGYQRLRRAVDMQFFEARSAGGLAVRFVGGEHIHRDHRGDPNARPPLVPVSAEKQREAIRFVCDELISGKYFDFSPELLAKLAPDYWGEDWLSLVTEGHGYPYADNVAATQLAIIYGLTSSGRLARVLDARNKTPVGQDVITAPEIFDALEGAIFGGLKEAVAAPSSNQAPALSEMRRNLQRSYVAHLVFVLLQGEGRYPAPVQTLARHYVGRLGRLVAEALVAGAGADTYTRSHLEECKARLERALEASYTLR